MIWIGGDWALQSIRGFPKRFRLEQYTIPPWNML